MLTTDHRARIMAARATGATWAAIAAGLNRDHVPAPRGGHWWPATVHRIADPEGHALVLRARRARWNPGRATDA
jgi:hypothetical protein